MKGFLVPVFFVLAFVALSAARRPYEERLKQYPHNRDIKTVSLTKEIFLWPDIDPDIPPIPKLPEELNIIDRTPVVRDTHTTAYSAFAQFMADKLAELRKQPEKLPPFIDPKTRDVIARNVKAKVPFFVAMIRKERDGVPVTHRPV